MLVPIELRRESTRDPYRLFFVEDEEIVINPSLTEKLRRDAGLEVPGDWIWEDKPIAQELDEIRHAIAGTGWTVREDAAIGLFSFQKYVMYRDLLDHDAQVASHPIVRSLAQGRLLPELTDADPDVPEPADLDDVQQPSEALSILDADASQRQCVEAAKRGRSFVMQGPPGTGKSQTIANVIAEAIGQGKRVLFVSEKAAALDVVFKRLTRSGLDEYCLMLHGEHAGRREVVQALDRSLTTSLQARPVMRPDEMERLANLRTLLNDSAELLHLPQPMLGGRTLREVHAQLAELHDAPSVAGAPEPDAIEGRLVLDDYQSLSEIFQRLSERWHVSPPDYLWRGYEALRFTADDHGRLVAILREISQAARTLAEPAKPVADEIGGPRPIRRTRPSGSLTWGTCSSSPHRSTPIGSMLNHKTFLTRPTQARRRIATWLSSSRRSARHGPLALSMTSRRMSQRACNAPAIWCSGVAGGWINGPEGSAFFPRLPSLPSSCETVCRTFLLCLRARLESVGSGEHEGRDRDRFPGASRRRCAGHDV